MTDAERKRFETLRAVLALKGFAVYRGDDDAGRALFIVTRWCLTRQLHGLHELEKFAEQVAPKVKP